MKTGVLIALYTVTFIFGIICGKLSSNRPKHNDDNLYIQEDPLEDDLK